MNTMPNDDLDIPWKRYRRDKLKIAREDLPPLSVAPWYRGPNPRFLRPGAEAPPSNIIPLPLPAASAKTQQEQDDEDDASLPR